MKNKKFDYLVCMCMGVLYSDIVNAITEGCTTFAELQDKLSVSTGCMSCKQEVKAILKKELKFLNKDG